MPRLKPTNRKNLRKLMSLNSSRFKVQSQKRVKRSFWLGLLAPIIISTSVFLAFKPTATQAQWTVFDPSVWQQIFQQNTQQTTRWISDAAKKVWETIKKNAGDVAFKNALRVFLGKIAEDTATWIASSGKGQGPLFPDTANYFKDLGKAAAGDYLDTLSKETFGFSLCDPGAAKLQIDIALRVNLNPNWCQESCQKNYEDGTRNLQVTVGDANVNVKTTLATAKERVSLVQEAKTKGGSAYDSLLTNGICRTPWTVDQCLGFYQSAIASGDEKLLADLKLCNNLCSAQRRKASCTLDQIGQNLQSGVISVNGYSVTGEALQEAFEKGKLPEIFEPEGNPLGQFLVLSQERDTRAFEKEQSEKEIRTESFGIGPVRSLISGDIKTPADITRSAAQEGLSTQAAGSAFGVYTGSPIADAIGIFTNTLTSKLIERIFSPSKGIVDPKAKSLVFNPSNAGSTGGVQAAKERFASLAQINFSAGGPIDILNELSACPTDVANVSATALGAVSPNNCVLDQSFRQAIEGRLTVQEAIDRGLLSDQKVFGFDANGREPDFRNGYPYRSLKILRKYRIIPVGWELAAQYIRDFEHQNVSISNLVKQFDDPTSPYFRLLDPSWVLKAPETMCAKTGFSEEIISQEYTDTDGDERGNKNLNYNKRYCNGDSEKNIGKECGCTSGQDTDNPNKPCISKSDDPRVGCFNLHSDLNNPTNQNLIPDTESQKTCAFITPREQQVQRREVCVDEQSCILENDDGSCKQFGTCVEEKDTWRFNGQSCSNQYASCQTFANPAGQQVTYLQNTLQNSVCSGSNAGCQQYCTGYDFNTGKWTCNASLANTKRFDRDVGSCESTSDGCTQFIRQTTGTNLVKNSSFEQSRSINVAGNTEFSGWTTGNGTQTCGIQTFVSAAALSGSQAARIQDLPDCAPPSDDFLQTVNTGLPIANRSFTISFYAKSEGAACQPVTQLRAGGFLTPAPTITVTPDWQRFSYAYTWDAARTESAFDLFFQPSTECVYLLDNVQVEEGASLTDYKDYGTTNLVHLKKPPSEANYNLGCTGNLATDPPACKNYIAKCTQADVGCDLFTPVSGGMSVPAKPGTTCPADQVGCTSFREQSTEGGVLVNHPTRTGRYCQSQLRSPNFTFVSCSTDAECGGVAGDCQPLTSFIAKTGQTCQASEVGCEAFTNLDEVAAGGEGKAQFTKLQLCVLPNDAQLADYYSWVGSNETGYQLKQFRLKRSNVDAGPCTNLQVSGTANAACIDNNPNPQATCTAADLTTNPDCAEFYDAGGTVYYRLRSRIIEGTENCQPFRNAVDNNVYYADSQKSLSCSAQAVGCREYIGNSGNNTRTILTSDFENGTYAPWTFTGGAANPSTESINYGGHSLQVNGTPAQAQANIDGNLRQGASYAVTFWAKSQAGDINLEGILNSFGGQQSFGTVAIKADWNQFTLGPLQFTQGVDGTNERLILRAAAAGFFVDNVVLTELTDSVYRVKASQTACGGFEGCQAYRNRSGSIQNLSDFARLCKSEKVGCEALINTQNSTNAFAETITLPNLRGDADGNGKLENADADYLNNYIYKNGPPPRPLESGDVNNDGSVSILDISALIAYLTRGTSLPSAPYSGDTIITPADSVEYWVNDPEKACQAEAKGCRAFGRESFGTKFELLIAESVYLKDNPDDYGKILCGQQALFCDEFTKPDGSKAYFKNPGGRNCTYQEGTSTQTAGWYITGTQEVCPTWNLNNIPPTVPYGGYAGLCPADQSGCGNFLDPVGTGQSLAANSNFEITNDLAGGVEPKSWTDNYCSNNTQRTCQVNSECGGAGIGCVGGGGLLIYNSASGEVYTSLVGTGNLRQTITLSADTYYVLSAEIKSGYDPALNITTDESAILKLENCRTAQDSLTRVYSPDNSMIYAVDGASLVIRPDRLSRDDYKRFSGRFYSGNAVTCNLAFGSENLAGPTGSLAHWFKNVEVKPTTNSSIIRQSVDSTSCNGQVGDKLGCRLFNDMSNPSLAYDVDQSPLGSSPANPDASGAPAGCTGQSELCDSNILLKVSRDRVCSKWLTPISTVESTKTIGQKENLTLAVATCDSFSPGGQCNHYVDELRCSNNPKKICVADSDCGTGATCKPFPITGNTQAYSREDLRNKTGLVVSGMQWSSTQTVRGNYPFGVAPQIGDDGLPVDDEVIAGNFSGAADLNEAGWEVSLQAASEGTKAELITSEILQSGVNVAPVMIDPYVKVTPSPGGSAPAALRTKTSTLAGKLSKGSSYMLTFKARYLTQPTVTDQTLTAGIASGLENLNTLASSFVPQYHWSGNIQPSTNWQQFIVGPLRLDPTATNEEGNTYSGTHVPFDPATGYIAFATSSSNRTQFAIDEVSLLPALQVDDAGNKYIARSCRSYPEPNALTCSYRDDTGKKFDGWRGYCLEKDPRNPKVCLSWYPVDLLAGERNIFGRVEAAGYADKAPLFMCIRAMGSYSTGTFASPYVDCGGTPSALCDQTRGYRRSIETFMGRGGIRINGLPDNTSLLESTGDCAEVYANCNSDPNNRHGICACSFEDFGDPSDQNFLIDESPGDNINNPVTYRAVSADQHYEYQIERIDWIIQTGSHENDDWQRNDGFTMDASNRVDNGNGTVTWYKDYHFREISPDAGPNGLIVRINFDTSNRIASFSINLADGTAGQGGAWIAGIVYLRELCVQVAQVVNSAGENAAWSENLQSSAFALPNYKYKLTQDDKPYGSIAPPEENFDNPLLWDGNSALPNYQPVQVKQNTSLARSGSAYMSNAGSPLGLYGRTCMGLQGYTLEQASVPYNCNNVSDITQCIRAGGYCNGVGPAKVCVAGPLVNTACFSDADCGVNGKCDYGYNQYYCSVVSGSGHSYGDACAQNSDCGTGGTCTSINNPSGGVYATRTSETYPAQITRALDRLQVLFANVYGMWQWNSTTNAYEVFPTTDAFYSNYVTSWQARYNNMSRCGTNGTDRSLIQTNPNLAYCGNTPSVSNVAIGAQPDGDVFITSGESIQLRFNTQVDSQQLPLKNIAIDWNGDFQSDQLLRWGFAPRTDPQDPHSVSYTYRFGQGFASGQCYDVDQGPYANNTNVRGHAYCIAKPQIQIQDNWSWCNGGRCLSYPVNGTAAYWQPYSGNVIVIR